jgi:hypothetical protein
MIAVTVSSPVFGCITDPNSNHVSNSDCGWLDLARSNSLGIHVIQSLVPNVFVAMITSSASKLLRILVRWGGIPQKTGVELGLMDRFFVFQIIVRAPGAVLDQFAHKNMSDHLSGCHIFVRRFRLFFQFRNHWSANNAT